MNVHQHSHGNDESRNYLQGRLKVDDD
jgi:hypothetical protein